VPELFSYGIFDITTHQIRPLHRRTFILNQKPLNRLAQYCNPLIVITALVTGPVFVLRGRNYLPTVWGDDRVLLDHAINRTGPIGRFHLLDPFGLLDPFAGYATFLLRLTTDFVRMGSLDHFASNTFFLMSIMWTLFACWIATIISRVAQPLIGFFAALAFAVMPFSNLVMLSQINPLYMPLVLILDLTVVTRKHPKSSKNQLLVVILFTALALTTVTVLVAFVYLAYLVFKRRENVQNIEIRLFRCLAAATVIQAFSYTPRGHSLSFGAIVNEFLRCANAFAPQFIRVQVLQQKSFWEGLVLYGVPIILFSMVFILIRISKTSPESELVRIALGLFVFGFVTMIALVIGNGWLNSHYLFIPTGLFWIGALLTAKSAIAGSNKYKFIPVGVLVVIFLSSISGTYFVI